MIDENTKPDELMADFFKLIELGEEAHAAVEAFERFVDKVMTTDLHDKAIKRKIIVGGVKDILKFTFKNALRNKMDYLFFYGESPLMERIKSPDAVKNFPLRSASSLAEGEQYLAIAEIIKLFHRKFESMDPDINNKVKAERKAKTAKKEDRKS